MEMNMLWIVDHFWTLALGYAASICLPCPFISRKVLSWWNEAGEWIRSKV